jgi:hypothetical protein
MGFDRAFANATRTDEIIAVLDEDFAARRKD